MTDDNDKHIIKLTKDVGELTGTVKALIRSVDGGFEQTRDAQVRDMAEVRKANSDQWDVIEKNRIDCAGKKDTLTRDCAEHRVKQARSSAISGGGSGGVVFIVLKALEWFFKGQWVG